MNYSDLTTAARSNRKVSFSSKLDIFTHHFPQNPLMPGALSAHLLSESSRGAGWSLKRINGLRFRKPLTPDLPVTFECKILRESPTEKVCSGKITSDTDTIADGEFVFSKVEMNPTAGERIATPACFWSGTQIRHYLPHGEPIVLIDEFVEANYPKEIQDSIANGTQGTMDQTKLLGTKIHTRSKLKSQSFWLDQNVLPSPVLSELVAQAGALTLAPFFTGTKPQVSLLGCDTEYFALAQGGATIDTFVELTRVKRLGKSANMIIFKSECYIGDTKIADVSLNAMANF